MSGRRALALAAIASAALAPHASADCTNFPLDPLCGSRVIASCSSEAPQEIDVTNGTIGAQELGPIRVTRIPDPQAPYPGPGNACDTGSHTNFDLASGIFAVEAGTVSDAYDFGLNVSAGASSRVAYDEYLHVTSASLPAATPVTLRLRLRVAFGADAIHSLPPAEAGSSYEYSRIDLILDSAFGPSSYAQHRWYRSADGTDIVSGVFLDPTQPFELTADTTVGSTVRLSFSLRSDASSYATYSNGFPTAATGGTAALVFGIESDTPGVTITSDVLGGAIPDFSGVTSQNAFASVLPVAVGTPVTVPEPAAATSGCVACTALLARRRRDADQRRARRSAHITSHSSR